MPLSPAVEHVLLWMYCGLFIVNGCVRIIDAEERYPRIARLALGIQALAAIGMVVYLTNTVIPGATYVWWALLVLFATFTVLEQALDFKRIIQRPEDRVPPYVNVASAALACTIAAVLDIPAAVMIYRLTQRT